MIALIESDIADFALRWPDALWGPAHSALEDGDLSNHRIDFCCDMIRVTLDRDWQVSPEARRVAAVCNFWDYDVPGARRNSTIELLETFAFLRVLQETYPEYARNAYND